MTQPKPTTRDPELTAVVKRAETLRVPMRELARVCQENVTTIWRWQYENDAPWARRKDFIDKATAYLDEQLAKYNAP